MRPVSNKAKRDKCHLNEHIRFACALILLSVPLTSQAAAPLATPDVDDIEYPSDEAPSAAEVKLGGQLFFDTRLSLKNDRSCASCHNPDLGFGDGLRKSASSNDTPLLRHTPSLYNLAWNQVFSWDGAISSLEEQALMPVVAAAEMNMPIAKLEKRLNEVPGYRKAFLAVYNDADINKSHIAQALAAYLRTLTSTNSVFDAYLAGNKQALSPEATRGLALFEGKAQCNQCHDGPNFSDESFHSLGIDDSDLGRGGVLKEPSLNHTFKTPGLRNISRSAPYMHDGSQPSLESVIRFYNDGGGPANHKDKLVKKLDLSERDIADLIAFLGALSSNEIVVKPTAIK